MRKISETKESWIAQKVTDAPHFYPIVRDGEASEAVADGYLVLRQVAYIMQCDRTQDLSYSDAYDDI